jgi:hypothetical protein
MKSEGHHNALIRWLGWQETPWGRPVGLWNVLSSHDPRLAAGSTVTLQHLRRLGIRYQAIAERPRRQYHPQCNTL